MTREFDFKGYRVKFPIGVNKDVITLILTHDDGTYGNHLIVAFNDIPYATIPIVDKDGLTKMIENLEKMKDEAFK